MTDDLVELLRDGWTEDGVSIEFDEDVLLVAADRIEQLEAALRRIEDENNYGSDGCWVADSYPDEIARAALGEKKDD
jgi:hypothetical protein